MWSFIWLSNIPLYIHTTTFYPFISQWTLILTGQTTVGKVMFLLLKTVSRFVIVFLPRCKCLLISWMQPPSAVILELKKIKSLTVSTVSQCICLEVMEPDAMTFGFWMPSLSQLFHCHISLLSRCSLVPLLFLSLGYYHLHISGCYFSQKSWVQLVLHPAQHFSRYALQIANIFWIIEKARELQKNIYFCLIDNTKAFDCVHHNKQ